MVKRSEKNNHEKIVNTKSNFSASSKSQKGKKTSKISSVVETRGIKPTIKGHGNPIIYDNTTEDIIMVNVSKVRLIYKDHMQHNADIGIVLAWFGLALSCLIAVLTSDFEKVNVIHRDLPKLLTFGFGFFFMLSFIKGIFHLRETKMNEKKYTDETFISELKNQKDIAASI